MAVDVEVAAVAEVDIVAAVVLEEAPVVLVTAAAAAPTVDPLGEEPPANHLR